MNLKTKQTLSTMLAVGSVLGTVGTVLLARKAALKEQYLNENGIIPYKSKTDEIRKKLPLYIPTIIVGVATVGSVIGSTVLSHKAQASLISMATIANRGWSRYSDKVKDVLGMESHNKVIKSIADEERVNIKRTHAMVDDGRKLYFDEYVGFFLAYPEKVAYAYADINQRLFVPAGKESYFSALIYDFIESCEGELLNKELDSDEMNWGWTMDYISETYDDYWLHMEYTEEKTVDGDEYCLIKWVEEPIYDPTNGGEHAVFNLKPEKNKFVPVLGKPKRETEV